jgi:hypothetical protein
MSQVKGIATVKLAIYEVSFWRNKIYNPKNFQTKKKYIYNYVQVRSTVFLQENVLKKLEILPLPRSYI